MRILKLGKPSGRKGCNLSEEHKRKLSENHSDVSGDKNPLYGITPSKETRNKLRESLKGKYEGSKNYFYGKSDIKGGRKPKKVVCVETGEVFSSMGRAAKRLGIKSSNISDCIKGRQYTAGGFHWKLYI